MPERATTGLRVDEVALPHFGADPGRRRRFAAPALAKLAGDQLEQPDRHVVAEDDGDQRADE